MFRMSPLISLLARSVRKSKASRSRAACLRKMRPSLSDSRGLLLLGTLVLLLLLHCQRPAQLASPS